MKIKEIACKTALSNSKLPGLDYALNPYIGCAHQCIYCYVPTFLHMNKSVWKHNIAVKRNLPLILAKELSKKRKGVVGISTVTDAYQPIEKKYMITRYSLEQLKKYDFPIQIQTKSDLVLRDIDLINHFSQAEIMMSIGTINEYDRRTLEPNTSSIKKRFNVLNELKDNPHLKTSVFFGPIYPNLNWEEIKELLDSIIDYNVLTIIIDNLHLKSGLKEQIISSVQHDPSLKDSFSDRVFSSSDWFFEIRRNIKKYIHDQSTSIKILDAF